MGSFRAAPEAAVDSGDTWEGGAGSTGTQVACEEAYPVLSRQPRGKAGTSGGQGYARWDQRTGRPRGSPELTCVSSSARANCVEKMPWGGHACRMGLESVAGLREKRRRAYWAGSAGE